MGKRARRSRHANPDDGSPKEPCKHHLATTKFLDKVRAKDSEAELFDTVAQLHVGFADGGIDTGGVEDSTHEV